MLHGCLHHEKERENVCPKCPFELLFGNSFNRILRVLFGRIVYKDVQPAERLYSLSDSFSTKLFLADVTFNQKAFTSVFSHQTPGFVSIRPFLEINDRNIRAFLGERDSDRAANTAVAACNDRYLAL